MPHITFEYSDNLEVDTRKFFAALHERLTATGIVASKGLKSRALRFDDWYISDGSEEYAFAHLNMLIRGGRSAEEKERLTREAIAVLEETFAERRENGYLSLSVDIKEMLDGEHVTRHNIPNRRQEGAL
jgi:5-carboxymethyl-2-hydroxymuconate isomerase